MLKFKVLQIAKLHNQFNQVDDVMRQFAKACTQIPSEHSHVAKKLEQVLNVDVVVKDPKKVEIFSPKDKESKTY